MNKEWCPYCHAMTYEDIYGHCCACGGTREKVIRTSDGYTKISEMSDEELYLELEHLSTAYLVDLPSGSYSGIKNYTDVLREDQYYREKYQKDYYTEENVTNFLSRALGMVKKLEFHKKDKE